jgi:hypothetical protein
MRLHYYVATTHTPARADPQTLVQIAAASDHRAVVLGMEVGFQGDSPATVGFTLQWLVQTNAGANGTAITPQKKDRGYDEAIQASFLEYQTDATPATEPTAGAVLASVSLHRQANMPWTLPFPIIVLGGERVGLRLLGHTGSNTIPVTVTLYMEE